MAKVELLVQSKSPSELGMFWKVSSKETMAVCCQSCFLWLKQGCLDLHCIRTVDAVNLLLTKLRRKPKIVCLHLIMDCLLGTDGRKCSFLELSRIGKQVKNEYYFLVYFAILDFCPLKYKKMVQRAFKLKKSQRTSVKVMSK